MINCDRCGVYQSKSFWVSQDLVVMCSRCRPWPDEELKVPEEERDAYFFKTMSGQWIHHQLKQIGIWLVYDGDTLAARYGADRAEKFRSLITEWRDSIIRHLERCYTYSPY